MCPELNPRCLFRACAMVVSPSLVEVGSGWWSESVADCFPRYKQVEPAQVTVENATGVSSLPKPVFLPGVVIFEYRDTFDRHGV